MTSIASSSVSIQTSAHFASSPPSWFGEVAFLSQHLRKQGVLDAICEQVRFARRRFGRFEGLDFVAVLFGYALSLSPRQLFNQLSNVGAVCRKKRSLLP